jgi:hypothetical protein
MGMVGMRGGGIAGMGMGMDMGMGMGMGMGNVGPVTLSTVIQMTNMVTMEDLVDDEGHAGEILKVLNH